MHPLVKNSWIAFILAACQQTPIFSTSYTQPSYLGQVTPITEPVKFTAMPTNRKLASSSETKSRVTAKGKNIDYGDRTQGYLESYRFTDEIQVRMTVEKIGDAIRLQNIPPIVIQMNIDSNGQPSGLSLAGELVAKASESERQKVLEQLTLNAKFVYASTTTSPLRQGDIVQSFKVFDLLTSGNRAAIPDAKNEGPGISGRLAGKALFEGRPVYLINWDGSEAISDQKQTGGMTMTVSGYSLVDAETALVSSSRFLTHMTFDIPEGKFVIQEIKENRIRF